jgi:hypothetical protein
MGDVGDHNRRVSFEKANPKEEKKEHELRPRPEMLGKKICCSQPVVWKPLKFSVESEVIVSR